MQSARFILYYLVSSRFIASLSAHQVFLPESARIAHCHLQSSAARSCQQQQFRGLSTNQSMATPINVIITGATGTAGSGALRQAIADPDVGRITVISRRPLNVEHEKLRVIIHEDFNTYDDIASELTNHQAALWCLGISQNAVTKEQYNVITYDYAMAAAKAFGAANPDSFRFLFLSGQGVDSTEKSRVIFARVKGKTENALARLGHPSAVSFRPAYIHPDVRTTVTMGGRIADALAVPAYKFLPAMIIRAADLGKSMLYVAKHGSDKPILTNTEMQTLANEYSAHSAEGKS